MLRRQTRGPSSSPFSSQRQYVGGGNILRRDHSAASSLSNSFVLGAGVVQRVQVPLSASGEVVSLLRHATPRRATPRHATPRHVDQSPPLGRNNNASSSLVRSAGGVFLLCWHPTMLNRCSNYAE